INLTQGVGSALEGNIALSRVNRDELGKMVMSVLASKPEITGMTLAFDPNALDGRDAIYVDHQYSDASGRFVPYFTNGPDGVAVDLLDMAPENGTESWYDLPMRENRDVLTPPYAYPIDGK